MIRSVLAAWTALALYGFSLGLAHSELYATRNLLKFPLLVTITAVVCSASWWISARAFGAPLSFTSVQRTVWVMFRDLGFLLASLSPVVMFFAIAARATDDGQLGEYDRFLALNIVCIAVCGVIALAKGVHNMFTAHAVARVRAAFLVASWLLIAAVVGGQAAFFMRPFFGFPATRGGASAAVSRSGAGFEGGDEFLRGGRADHRETGAAERDVSLSRSKTVVAKGVPSTAGAGEFAGSWRDCPPPSG